MRSDSHIIESSKIYALDAPDFSADYPQCEYTLVYFLVALPFEVFTPSAVAAGIETWTWVIAERPDMEVAIMCEVLTAWFGTVKERKGVFSPSSK